MAELKPLDKVTMQLDHYAQLGYVTKAIYRVLTQLVQEACDHEERIRQEERDACLVAVRSVGIDITMSEHDQITVYNTLCDAEEAIRNREEKIT